jgi:hypothetical protein
MRLRNIDGTVKSPDAALRGIPRHCDVPLSTPHSSGFARLACELFTAPSENPTFYEFINLGVLPLRGLYAPGFVDTTLTHRNSFVNIRIVSKIVHLTNYPCRAGCRSGRHHWAGSQWAGQTV